MGSLNDDLQLEEQKKAIIKEASSRPTDRVYSVQKAILRNRARELLGVDKQKNSPAENTDLKDIESIQEMLKQLQNLAVQPYTVMQNKRVWFVNSRAILFPCLEELSDEDVKNLRPHSTPSFTGLQWEGFHFEEQMTSEECGDIFIKRDASPYRISNSHFHFGDNSQATGIVVEDGNNHPFTYINKTLWDISPWQNYRRAFTCAHTPLLLYKCRGIHVCRSHHHVV